MKTIKLSLLALILSCLSHSSRAERGDLQVIELQYGDRAPLKLYANSKYSLTIYGFPSDAHLTQVMPRLRTDFLDLRILGERSLEVGSNKAASVEFGLQIPSPHQKIESNCSTDPLDSNACSNEDYISYGELRIKSFSKSGDDSYAALEDYIIPIHTTFCLEHKPVCGLINGRRVTYSDSCELGKAGAELLYEASCQY